MKYRKKLLKGFDAIRLNVNWDSGLNTLTSIPLKLYILYYIRKFMIQRFNLLLQHFYCSLTFTLIVYHTYKF